MTKEFPNDQMTNARFTEEFGTKQYKKSPFPNSSVAFGLGDSFIIMV
jgi:hypothetical protein